jgi:beta-N-acetylhexosaminidase
MIFKKQLVYAPIYLLSALLLCACGSRAADPTPTALPVTAIPASVAEQPTQPPAQAPDATSTPPAASPDTSDSDARIEEMVAQMTLEEKLGQLFMVFFDGTEFSPELERTIQELHVGGILIFHINVGPVEELAALIAAAQGTAAASGAQIPLFVAVDHEGGLIDRFGGRLTTFPGPMAIAATGSVENARAVAEAMSAELRALGINMNLAPVVDVNNNPNNPVIGVRAFGSTPEIVTTFSLAMLEGFQQGNMMTTAKHFPGHGDTAIDSHSDLPVIDKELAQLEALELVPFAAAIEAGTDVIMTAHVAVPPLTGDPQLPATFSHAILTDLLRDDMGFEGLIAADSLGMAALDLRYGITQTSALAVEGGVDLLMFGNDPGHIPVEQYQVFEYLLARIKAGDLTEARLDESVRRILQAKARHGLLNPDPALASAPSVDTLQHAIRTPEHLALTERVSEQAVTLVRDDAQLLPLRPEQSIALIHPDFETELPMVLGEQTDNLTAIPITIDPDAEERGRVTALAASADVILLATYNANFHAGQVALVEELQGQPLVIMALTSPYDLLAFPQQPTYLITYNNSLPLLSAAAKLLYGQIQPAGTLPVELPPLFPTGSGIGG